MLAAALVMSLSISSGDEVAELDPFCPVCCREASSANQLHHVPGRAPLRSAYTDPQDAGPPDAAGPSGVNLLAPEPGNRRRDPDGSSR